MNQYLPRLIGFSAALLMLLPGIYCQLNGQIYRNGEGRYFGWPIVHAGDEYRFLSNAFIVDIASTIVIAAATGFTIEHMIRGFRNRARFRLSWMFVCLAIPAIVLNLFRLQGVDRIHHWSADFVDRRAILDPIAVRYPPFVMIPILFGLACTLYAVALLSRRGLHALRGITNG